MKKLLISLFDHSGNASKPYKESGEWEVIQVDLKLGVNILTWDYKSALAAFFNKHSIRIGSPTEVRIGIICMIPCTEYALSGVKHFKRKDADGTTELSQLLVKKSKEIIDYCDDRTILEFWQIENPMSRIHTLNPWMGKPVLKFNPCDYAGYSDNPENDRYNKQTWLWGKFNIPEKKRLEPIYKENPGWKNLGGKSERTKELRSITPVGFSKAFYQANH